MRCETMIDVLQDGTSVKRIATTVTFLGDRFRGYDEYGVYYDYTRNDIKETKKGDFEKGERN